MRTSEYEKQGTNISHINQSINQSNNSIFEYAVKQIVI